VLWLKRQSPYTQHKVLWTIQAKSRRALDSGQASRARLPREQGSGVNEPLLTTRQVAERLGLSPATVLRRYRAGEIPGYRLATNVLRFRADELEAWLQTRRS
jgi:excisionase family DNA binding protein